MRDRESRVDAMRRCFRGGTLPDGVTVIVNRVGGAHNGVTARFEVVCKLYICRLTDDRLKTHYSSTDLFLSLGDDCDLSNSCDGLTYWVWKDWQANVKLTNPVTRSFNALSLLSLLLQFFPISSSRHTSQTSVRIQAFAGT
jgi:hypothetical protein